MKTVYLNDKKIMTKRRIKKIGKKLYKISKKEDIVVALSNKLSQNEDLIYEINNYNIEVLNRKMDF